MSANRNNWPPAQNYPPAQMYPPRGGMGANGPRQASFDGGQYPEPPYRRQQSQSQQQQLQPPAHVEPPLSPAAVLASTDSGLGATGGSRSNTVSSLSSGSRCSRGSHSSTSCAGQGPLSTEHYRKQLQRYREEAMTCGGETARVNVHLNEIFLQRLQDIDCNADGDADLKLLTYQEWVDMLLKINENIISNMEGLESEVAERLELLNRKANAVNCRHSQGNELAKCRKDICTLVKIIQNGYYNDNWSLQGLQLETLSPAQVLGLNDRQRCITGDGAGGGNGGAGGGRQPAMNADAAQRNKLIMNMKCLAVEVAEKHDEICSLKQQILCLEDEIQKAQAKIQLKDDVIRELRNDLKHVNAKLSCQLLDLPFLAMAPINLDSQHTTRSATTQVSGRQGSNRFPFTHDDCSQFESLSHNEHLEQEKLKELEDELNELFEMTKDLKKQNLEYHRKRLCDIFQKSESEKIEAYRKLDYIRRQLIDLEATGGSEKWNDCDSGFSSKSETNQDAKILEALRRRLNKLNECSFELTKRVQKMEIENNELCTNLHTEKCFAQCNSEMLKQVADLLCNLSGQQFNYKDIYNKQDQQNPFCAAILQLKKRFLDREKQLALNLTCKNKKIEELEETIYNSQQLQLSQEDSGRLNDSLKCQIDHLQHTICEKEQCITKLNVMLSHLSSAKNDPRNLCNCCGRQKGPGDDHDLRELRCQLDQTRCRVETLLCELERSQKQERFLNVETRKLSEELLQSKSKSNELICQIRRLAALLKSQESHRMDLSQKFEIMEQNYGEQSKKLRAANAQLNILQERFSQVEKRGDEHTMERNLLREEVLALKEKEACLLGKHKGLQDQLLKTERELFKAHDVIKEQRCIMYRNNCAHKDIVKRLQETGNAIKQQLDCVVQDYRQLEGEYKKQGEICAQNEKVIESFRKWKEAQLQADEASRKGFKQYEEHIKLLLEEKQKFLERFRDLHRDYCLLQSELERLKMCNISASAPSINDINSTMGQRLDLLRNTYRRIAEQCNALRSDSAPGNYLPTAPS